MNINAKIGIDKQKHPERYCPQRGCLWKTSKLNHTTQQHEGGGYCPRHKSAKQLVMEWLRDYPVRHDTTESHILWLLSRRFTYLSSNELKMYLDEFMQGVKVKTEPVCTCGHDRKDHAEEPPYSCDYEECMCCGFEYPTRKENQ